MPGDKLTELAGAPRTGKRVGILTIGQEHHLDVHLLLEEHIDSTDRRLDTGGITIIKDSNIVGKTTDQPDLPSSQRRTRRGDHILDAGLVHADHVHITLDQETMVLTDNCLLRLEKAIKLIALMIDLALRRIHVFCRLLRLLQDTPTESHHLTTQRMHRKDHPATETVVSPLTILVGNNKACLLQVFPLVSRQLGSLGQGITLIERISQLELADRLLTQATLYKIAQTHQSPIEVLK